jgi:hypothetical protein
LRLFDGGKIFHEQVFFGASYIVYATILTNKEVDMGSKRGGWCNWEGFGKNIIELKIVVLDRSHHYVLNNTNVMVPWMR